MTIGILGGGLTGCTLGKIFSDKGWSFEILEGEPEIGGLLRSANVNGYTFDLGGPHILFSKDKHALAFLLNAIVGNVCTRRRNTKVLFKGRFVKYPFENGLSDLPLTDNLACLTGFTAAVIGRWIRKRRKTMNFREWCLTAFGRGISNRYLIPYNEKIWKFPLAEIATGWVERIPSPSWKDVFKSSLGIKTEGYLHQLDFHYPRTGGIQAVIEGLTRDFPDRIVTDFEVDSVAKVDGKWAVSNGKRTRTYDAIVSTIPLPTLAEAASLPNLAREAAQDLKLNSVVCVCLGGVKPRRAELSWVYVPAKKVLTHRVSFLSNFSDMSSPKGKHSLTTDITCKFDDRIWRMSDETLVKMTINDLLSEGVLESGEYETALVVRHRHGYVIDDIARSENIRIIRKYLDNIGILICGRFAEFEYLNMDAVVRHSLDFVSRNRKELESAS